MSTPENTLSGLPITLTIAGSDSSGGAGIQADLKTFSALGTYGASVITAITAQNTQNVTAVHTIPTEIIRAQLKAVFDDLDITAVKIGMLGNADVIETVAAVLQTVKPRHIIVDPVMVAKSGDSLLEQSAIESMKAALIPIATLITPNLPEAAVLADIPEPDSIESMREAVSKLNQLGAAAILLKGGHLPGDECQDLLIKSDSQTVYANPRIQTKNTHGTGCTLSSAICAYLAHGLPLESAVEHAIHYVQQAITKADNLQVGHGHGPLAHFLGRKVM